MAQRPVINIDLSALPNSNGDFTTPAPNTNSTQVNMQTTLANLTSRWNGNPGYAGYWGVDFIFINGLPQGYSYWQRTAQGQGALIMEFYGLPTGRRFRSVKRFFDHVVEFMHANEGTIRGWIAASHPDNVINNQAINRGSAVDIVPFSCSC